MVKPISGFVLILMFCIGTLGYLENAYGFLYMRGTDGGDCNIIGNWNHATKTCTFTKDTDDFIFVTPSFHDGTDANSDGITLDGNGHIMTLGSGKEYATKESRNPGYNWILNIWSKNVTIKNFIIHGSINESPGWRKSSGINAVSDVGTRIINNTIHNHEYGISGGSIIEGNKIYSNDFGIIPSGNVIIAGNEIYSNNHGIEIASRNDLIKQNTISNNTIGINFSYDEVFTKIYNNNFIKNPTHVKSTLDIITAQFDDPSQGGNYWSDFSDNCNDLNKDNFCDKPYEISEPRRIYDNFPWHIRDAWKTKITTSSDISLVTNSSGMIVNFSVSAKDEKGSVDVRCAPKPGSVFPIGETPVLCTAETGRLETFVVDIKNASSLMIKPLSEVEQVVQGKAIKINQNGSEYSIIILPLIILIIVILVVRRNRKKQRLEEQRRKEDSEQDKIPKEDFSFEPEGEMTLERCYDILGVSSDATPVQIKEAYKRKVQSLHPDRNTGSKFATEILKKLNNAYEFLQKSGKA